MKNKLIFFEGQPGSGKSSLSQYIFRQINLNNKSVYWMDEYEQNNIQFKEFWIEYNNPTDKDIIDILINCWIDLIKRIKNTEKKFILDSALFSYSLYLKSLEIPEEKINKYFNRIENLLKELNPKVIFLYGDTESVVSRACSRRGENWTKYTINNINSSPYQRKRNRTGFKGMLDYFKDGQILYKNIASNLEFPILHIDITKEKWKENELKVLKWLGYEKIDDTHYLPKELLNKYVGKYKVSKDFPVKDEKLCIELDKGQLILKGTYWEDYKLKPKTDKYFHIQGIPMYIDFKIDNGKVIGFNYTFINRLTYYCSKISEF
ncbi:MAG: hypothetical protein FH751_02320 [Firmicutes bacterium]|nr:hypothetical protein [Bacillota bacterium]